MHLWNIKSCGWLGEICFVVQKQLLHLEIQIFYIVNAMRDDNNFISTNINHILIKSVQFIYTNISHDRNLHEVLMVILFISGLKFLNMHFN